MIPSRLFHVVSALLIASLSIVSCTSKRAELGSEKNPVKLFFTPSLDARMIEDASGGFKTFLEKDTGYHFEVAIPQSYIAVVEAFGTKRADVALMNTFGYVLAHEKYGAEARLTALRGGSDGYQSQFIVKANGPIKKLEDLKGKKVAFVDPASASGYLLPLKKLRDRHIEPKETVFAGKHDNVVTMVYNGQADGGATFYTIPDENGEIRDARRLVKTQYPDVEKKIKILELSDSITNDPIIFRKDLADDMKVKITDALVKYSETPEGKEAFHKLFSIDGLKRSSDSHYDSARKMLQELGKSAEELMKK